MGRGGGTVAGSKHSVSNDHHHGSSGPADPFTTGICLIIFGVVCAVLTIVVPILLVAKPSGDSCSPSKSINRNEQMICLPNDLSQTWVAEYESKGAGYAKVYKVDNTTLEEIHREYKWDLYYAKLKGTYDYFSFSVPIKCKANLTVYCDGKKCDDLKMYLLTKAQYDLSVDSNNEFHEKTFKRDFKDFDDEEWNYFTIDATGPEAYYLVFSNKKSKSVEILYNIEFDYTIYNMSSYTPEVCEDNKCKFKDMKKNEILVLDFPSSFTRSIPDEGGREPDYFDAKMHNTKISWSGVIAAIVVLGLATILCIGLGLLCVVHILG